MSIRPSPLLGYNNNVRHKGRVFHIQTEDSGARYGHIMTHLFADGGRILKSVKTSYAEYIGNERMAEIVREMMKQQHKAMFIALRDGKFDAPSEGTSESRPPPPPPSTASLGSTFADGAPKAGAEAGSPAPPPASQRQAVVPPPLARGASDEPEPSVRSAALRAPESSPAISSATRVPPENLPLDIDALERAAAVDGALPAQRSSSDLPPPPAELLREKTATPVGAAPVAITPVPPRRPSSGPMVAARERRYAPTRPASIFGQARPQHGKSIFGEDLMSDKSLDEVILSYLAEDLEDQSKK